ncbi:MAG: hypothetical protein Q9217_003667 [Psora testacea]
MSSPSSLKRTFDEAGLEAAMEDSNVHKSFSPPPSQPMPVTSQTPSPALAPTVFSTSNPPVDDGPMPFTSMTPNLEPMATSTASTTKKARLTFAEKEARRMGKECKEQQKAEERARKDEERIRKEEEKAKKVDEKKIRDAEREQKRKAKEEKDRLREEEKAKREEEKRQKEEEKNKKARTQLRLNAFFGQPSAPTKSSTGSPTRDDLSPPNSRCSSIAEADTIETNRQSRSVSLTPPKPALSDYERAFPPFFLQSHTSLAPFNHFLRDEQGLPYAQSKIDEGLFSGYNIQELSRLAPRKSRQRYRLTPTVKDILVRMNGTPQNPIELSDAKDTSLRPAELLRPISMKVLKFAEDVRPPYIGTYTKLTDRTTIARLSRNPFSRGLPEADYDYDSEAEWEDPGEGEDLDSEGEEELDEEDEDEMEGFLDDEETADPRAVKRRPLLGDLQPTCTGICWTGELSAPDLSIYGIDMLIGSNAFLQPAQSPLKLGHDQLNLSQNHSQPNAPNISKPNKRLIPNDLFEDFKKAVQGSDLTKVGLVEVLKKQFPKQSKDVLKDTLDLVAERVGGKLAEKRWVLREGV